MSGLKGPGLHGGKKSALTWGSSSEPLPSAAAPAVLQYATLLGCAHCGSVDSPSLAFTSLMRFEPKLNTLGAQAANALC